MEQERSQELISAYFDREVTPAERSEAEKRLGESAEARDELAEVENLSSLLAGLPRRSAPPEFRARVMQAAEQRMLLPARPGESALVHRASRRRRAWQGAGALAATAAALVLTVLAVDRFGESRTGRGNAVASRPAATEAPVVAEAESAARDEGLVRLGHNEKWGESVAAADVPATESGRSSESFRRGGIGGGGLRGEARFEFDMDKLRDAELGQVIEGLDRSSGEMNVVLLTVVDRRQGLADLQVVLSRNGVAVETPPAEPTPAKGGDAAAEDDFIAVYVEAGDEQLAAAMESIRHNAQFQHLEVDEPMAFAELDERVQNQIAYGRRALAEMKSTSGADEKSDDAAEAAALPPAEAAGEKADRSEESGPAIAESATKRPDVAAAPPSAGPEITIARQMQIPLPEEVRSRDLKRFAGRARRSLHDSAIDSDSSPAKSSSPGRSKDAEGAETEVARSKTEEAQPAAPADKPARRESRERLFAGKGGPADMRPLHVLFVLMGPEEK